MRYLARLVVAGVLVSGAVWLGKAYSLWSMERHLRSVAANAAAPGIDVKEFERRNYGAR